MSTTVLPQLQAVEAELASQVTQLEAQLALVQEKLTGLRTVMPMFAEAADAGAAVVAADTDSSVNETEEEAAVAEPVAAKASKAAKTKVTKTKKTATKKTAAKQVTSSKKVPAQKTTTKKKDGRAASWQKYTRPGVKNQSMPDAVKLILETQPENDFKIADVMTALFTEDMPKSQYLKARNRISNVLSGGVRAGDWHKGERGTYRMMAG